MSVVQLTRQQARCLAAVAVTGDRLSAAELLGLSASTLAIHLGLAYERLEVRSSIAAFRVLGWLEVPTELLDIPEAPGNERPLVFLGVR